MELGRSGGGVAGRFFVKQDHQGPPGFAHGGIVGAALDEAMSLAVHAEDVYALTKEVQLHLHAPAPVGTFVHIEAKVERREGKRLWARATASTEDGERLAEATGLFVRVDREG
jgi:acyl-coenzyme A thioesterase PaaI-like protein